MISRKLDILGVFFIPQRNVTHETSTCKTSTPSWNFLLFVKEKKGRFRIATVIKLEMS